MSARALAAALVLLSLLAPAHAQVRVVREGDDRLHGIVGVDVLVEVAATAERCVLTRTALQSSARDVLVAGGLGATVSEKARSGFYSLVVNVRTGATHDACATAVATELVAEVRGLPEADAAAPAGAWGSILKGAMPLARDNALVITAPSAHDATVQDTVRAQAAAIAERIRLINP